MLIALPRKITGMRTLEQEISSTVVNKWLKNMTNRSAALFLDWNSEMKCNKSCNLEILRTSLPQDSRGGVASV